MRYLSVHIAEPKLERIPSFLYRIIPLLGIKSLTHSETISVRFMGTATFEVMG